MDSPLALPLGARLDDYEIERLLSSDGSFSMVYIANDRRRERVAARQQMLQQRLADWRRADGPLGYAAQVEVAPSAGPRVAIKEFFPSEMAQRRSGGQTVVPRTGQDKLYAWSRGRFLDEAKFLLQHAHPNVVAVFEVLSANNTEYMVMELLDGGSLESQVSSGAGRSEAGVRRWLLPVLRGLQSTERGGVDHLDLSPQNIVFRSRGGDPVLIDFGAARMSAESRTGGTQLIVNNGYSAPEKYHVTSRGLTARADVYAIGALINFALTGERPASAMGRDAGTGLDAAAQAARSGRASPRFLAAVDQCFQLDPRRRPADAAATERVFAPWGDAPTPGPAAPHGVMFPLVEPVDDTEPARRRRVYILFFALLALLLLLLVIGPALAAVTPASSDHTFTGDRRGD